jgi:cell division protein FtsB
LVLKAALSGIQLWALKMTLLDGQLSSRRFLVTVRWTLVVALWTLLMSMASGQSGISNYMELVSKRNVLVDVNTRLKIENQLMEERIQRLKTSSTEQVRFLKEEFGYVQEGEYIYRFDGEKKNAPRGKAPVNSHTTESEEKVSPNG